MLRHGGKIKGVWCLISLDSCTSCSSMDVFEIKILTCLRHYVRNTRKHRFLAVKIFTYVAFSPHGVCPPVRTYSEVGAGKTFRRRIGPVARPACTYAWHTNTYVPAFHGIETHNSSVRNVNTRHAFARGDFDKPVLSHTLIFLRATLFSFVTVTTNTVKNFLTVDISFVTTCQRVRWTVFV